MLNEIKFMGLTCGNDSPPTFLSSKCTCLRLTNEKRKQNKMTDQQKHARAILFFVPRKHSDRIDKAHST